MPGTRLDEVMNGVIMLPDVSKAMYPTDGDFQKGKYQRISEVVEKMNGLGAKHALVIADG
jgi:hypothetical protein